MSREVIDPKGMAAWGYGGQTVERGDWQGGQPSTNPADHANAWKKQTVLCEHELPGMARHDPLGYLQNFSVVASCRVHSIDPQQYLDEILRLLPYWPKERYLELAPKQWKTTRAKLRPDELAAPLAAFTIPAA